MNRWSGLFRRTIACPPAARSRSPTWQASPSSTSTRTWGARAISDHAFATAGVAHPVTIEVNDVHTLLALVATTSAWRSSRNASPPNEATTCTVPLAPGSAADWQVSVAIPTGSAASLAADALIGMLPTSAGSR